MFSPQPQPKAGESESQTLSTLTDCRIVLTSACSCSTKKRDFVVVFYRRLANIRHCVTTEDINFRHILSDATLIQWLR